MMGLVQQAKEGAATPFALPVLEQWALYLDARRKHAAGALPTVPSVEEVLKQNGPYELLAGIVDLVTKIVLEGGNVEAAVENRRWFERQAVRRIGPDHPARFEATLRLAEVLALPEADAHNEALTTIEALERDVFAWTRLQALSGSYDAAVASRVLGDELLLIMAQMAESSDALAPVFADALGALEIFGIG